MQPIPQTELSLVRDLQAKLPAAFASLYDSYSPAMFGVLINLVKDHEQAEDLLHDAFIRVLSNINKYDSNQGRLFTWLLTITRRVGLDELRNQKIRLSAATYIYEWSDQVAELKFSEGMVNQPIINTLEPKYRQVVDLLYFREFTYQEVADELKIPLGTVKTRYRMALQLLKHSFSHDIRKYNVS